MEIGITGLPNIGKSTLFNALLKKQQALVANYPFATIEPNIGIIPVPDPRLNKLAEITKNEEHLTNLPPIKAATIQFVDIAGLVKGASEGAGLGNKFLSHIRQVQVIAHVVRAFEDPNIIKEGAVDPKSDYDTINTELMLADLSTLQKVLDNRKLEQIKKQACEKAIKNIDNGTPLRSIAFTPEEQDTLKDLFLLSLKKEIVILNISESGYHSEQIQKTIELYAGLLEISPENCIVISAKIEEELSQLSEDDQKMYLSDLGLEQSGLERLIQKAYTSIGLISFLTAGEKEIRAWTIKKGMNASQAAGEIHTDFIKHFIKAEVVPITDFIESNGWKGSREVGKARMEGKEYVVQDGDVIEFKIGK